MVDPTMLVWDDVAGDVTPVMEYNTDKEIVVAGLRPETCGLYCEWDEDAADRIRDEAHVGWVAEHVIDFPTHRVVVETDDRAHTAIWFVER